MIGPDQICGVRGRYIGENVAFLRNLVEFTSETKTPATILSLDQEKAFDRVDWVFLFHTLSRFAFGPSFISWVRLLYTDVRSTVLLNGYPSDSFRPSRSVRQGCPLSPLLYIISIEVLAVNLRAHPDIVGLRPPGLSTSLPIISLYGDDTSVVVLRTLLSSLSLIPMKSLKRIRVPSLILVSARAFGLVLGVFVVALLPLTSLGRRQKLKS